MAGLENHLFANIRQEIIKSEFDEESCAVILLLEFIFSLRLLRFGLAPYRAALSHFIVPFAGKSLSSFQSSLWYTSIWLKQGKQISVYPSQSPSRTVNTSPDFQAGNHFILFFLPPWSYHPPALTLSFGLQPGDSTLLPE